MSDLFNENDSQDRSGTEHSGNNNESESTTEQRMLDAYDENFRTDEWDAQERDAMAREAYEPEGANYSADEYRQILEDSGYGADEINEIMANDSRYANIDEYQGEHHEYQEEYEDNKPKTKWLKGTAAVLGAGAKYIAPKAARAITAGAGTILGATAGLVSEDYSNVLKWGAAAGGSGYLIGKGLSNIPEGLGHLGNAIDEGMENVASTFTLNAKGSQAEKERKQKEADARAKMDQNRRSLYKEKLRLRNNAEINQAMEDAQKYREFNITDDKLIIKAMQHNEFGEERAANRKIALAALAKEVGRDDKKLKSITEQLKNKGVSDRDIKSYIKGIRQINDWNIQ